MAIVRSALGLDQPAIPKADADLVKRRLTNHKIRLQAIDARIDVDVASDRKLAFKRRASDR